MILSIVRGDFKSFFGKKTNTRETWKTGFKPNILEVKSKRFVLRKIRVLYNPVSVLY